MSEDKENPKVKILHANSMTEEDLESIVKPLVEDYMKAESVEDFARVIGSYLAHQMKGFDIIVNESDLPLTAESLWNAIELPISMALCFMYAVNQGKDVSYLQEEIGAMVKDEVIRVTQSIKTAMMAEVDFSSVKKSKIH